MNTAVGILLLVTGSGCVATGLALAVAELLSGRHSKKGPIARAMAGVDWKGIAAVLNALAAVLKAMRDWPLSALLVLFGLATDVVGVWILAARPIF